MAAPARILSLNLGTQTIGMAEFQRADNGGIVLNAYKLTEILSDPTAEAMRLPQTRLAVAEMKDTLKLRGGGINYAISGQNLFTRFVKLPTVAEEKVEQIIGFEAQQNVPFPIEEVIWDYQLVGGIGKDGGNGNGNGSSAAGGQVEVVLVAIKADLLDDLNGTAESSGFRTQIVDAAPVALYNAFRYNYSDLPGCSLLVDLGARTTNLIFIEPGKVFSRSINIGGNTITTALAKEFQETFVAAEERKKRDGYVSLGGAYADNHNAEVAKAAKIIRNTMTRLHSEISRTINFYRAQQNGSQPARLFLCGGTANLPYLREFFAEKFQLPLEYFNPLRNVTVTSNVNVEEVVHSAHLLGELVGLGLRSINNCPMELNLRPASVVRAQRIASRRPYFVTAGLCLLLALAGWWLYFLRAANIQSDVLAEVNGKVAVMQGFESKFQKANADIQKINTVAAPLNQTVEDRQFWAKIINELNARLPEKYIWITSLQPTVSSGNKSVPLTLGDAGKPLAAPGSMVPIAAAGAAAKGGKGNAIDGILVQGMYLHNPNNNNVVVEYVNNLAKSELFALDMKNPNSIYLDNPAEDPKAWATNYKLQLTFKKPLPLP